MTISLPSLCCVGSVNTDSGQDVASVADKQVSGRFQKLQGRVRNRWMDDAMRIKNGSDPLSNADMKAAAIQWVVHAANEDADKSASDQLCAWIFQYRAEERKFLLFCTDASGKK